jgi:hypothetical protein
MNAPFVRGCVDPRAALLVEMVREAERVLDRVLRSMEEQDDKTEQGIALAIATLGGGLAIASLSEAARPILLAAIGVGAALNLAAVAGFLDAYVGISGGVPLCLALDPRWLVDTAADDTWSLERHLEALVGAYGEAIRANVRALALVAQRRKRALTWLMASVAVYAIGGFLILAGRMSF